ncbi:tyrosine phosphatase family protein [Aquamicrobium segne]|uniref:Tyrosine phosphatase family protein n=1 Tax=Aquamicrobium segne TaxID=469547 RepID=A0ABW0H327_9HYPH
MLYVCPLSKLEKTVLKTGAGRLVTLLSAGTDMVRPASIRKQDHLYLRMNDIAELRDGLTTPGEAHVRALMDFAREWDRARPMVIHCYAGISRSTAAAYIVASVLNPARDEAELAAMLRWLSPSATPNPRLIEVADSLLERRGRMVAAIKNIGRGAEAFEGEPFRLDPFD